MPAYMEVSPEENPMGFVAYNLVFGPSSNGLPDITPQGLASALSGIGYDASEEDARAFLSEWHRSGLLTQRLDGAYLIR